MSAIVTGAPAANFIARQWVPSRRASVYEHRGQWAPSETLGRSPSAQGDDVAVAGAAAVQANHTWSRQDV